MLPASVQPLPSASPGVLAAADTANGSDGVCFAVGSSAAGGDKVVGSSGIATVDVFLLRCSPATVSGLHFPKFLGVVGAGEEGGGVDRSSAR